MQMIKILVKEGEEGYEWCQYGRVSEFEYLGFVLEESSTDKAEFWKKKRRVGGKLQMESDLFWILRVYDLNVQEYQREKEI